MPVMTESAPQARILDTDELYPIRDVARLTGINPVTLRAWERRYGLIQPTRTESGHRLYSMSDIETVRSILDWIDRGVAVSKVGKLLARQSSAAAPSKPLDGNNSLAQWTQWQRQVTQAVSAFDEALLERLYGQVFSSYPLSVVFQDILLPLWRELLQQNDFGQISEWLFYDAFLRGRIQQRLQLNRPAQSRPVLVAGIGGKCRELELLVAGLLVGGSDLPVSVLAPGQPFDELTLVCERMQPQALVLFSSRPPASDLPRRLNRLALATDCPVFIAGEMADLAHESLVGSSIGCLGSDGRLMHSRLQQYLGQTLDT